MGGVSSQVLRSTKRLSYGLLREHFYEHLRVMWVQFTVLAGVVIHAFLSARVKMLLQKYGTLEGLNKNLPKKAIALETLPGHADEIYALDWSPNGTSVAT